MGGNLSKILKINPLAPEPDFIGEAAEVLRQGEVVIFPTDTVYGIGMLATEYAEPAKIFACKRRPPEKSIPLLIASLEDLDRYSSDLPAYALDLASKHFPGALTLVVRASEAVPRQFRSDDGSVALRVPAHALVLALLKEACAPLAASSANLSGQTPVHSIEEIPTELAESVPLIIDGGSLRESSASTVVSCLEKDPQILRQGPIPI